MSPILYRVKILAQIQQNEYKEKNPYFISIHVIICFNHFLSLSFISSYFVPMALFRSSWTCLIATVLLCRCIKTCYEVVVPKYRILHFRGHEFENVSQWWGLLWLSFVVFINWLYFSLRYISRFPIIMFDFWGHTHVIGSLYAFVHLEIAYCWSILLNVAHMCFLYYSIINS